MDAVSARRCPLKVLLGLLGLDNSVAFEPVPGGAGMQGAVGFSSCTNHPQISRSNAGREHLPMNHMFSQSMIPILRRIRSVGSLVVALCAATPSYAELQKSGTFQGSWTAIGSAQTLLLGESHSASILRLRGTVVTQSSAGLTRALQSDCVALNLQEDRKTGLGRCVWTDSDGDRAFSEVTGALSGLVSKVRGRFIGGTGKYVGLEGGYELEWKYLHAIEEEATIHGYSTGLTGSWKLP